jgi:hypothetical protein
MGIGILLFIAAVFVLALMQYHADVNRIHDDYEDWKNNRR